MEVAVFKIQSLFKRQLRVITNLQTVKGHN